MTLRLYPGRKNLDELWRFKVVEPSYVYVLKAERDRPIKVGYAANVITRMAELQTGNPRPLELLYVLPGDRDLEWQLHGVAEKMLTRLTGEWFVGPDLSEFLGFVGDLEDRMIEAVEAGKAFSWRFHFPKDCLLPKPVRVKKQEPAMTVAYVEPNPLTAEEQAERERQRQAKLKRPAPDDTWYPGKEEAA